MKNLNTFFLVILLGGSIFLGAACIRVKPMVVDGGIFKSYNKGEVWQQRAGLLSVGAPRSISHINTNFLVFDPQDHSVVYLGTKEEGLFISYDSGESWQAVAKLPRASVDALTIDPRAKNVIYASIGNRIFKSIDCCRSWQEVYLEGVAGVSIPTLTVDPFSTNKIYAGLSDGRLLRSINGGLSWGEGFKIFPASIRWLKIHPQNKTFYLGTVGGGFWRSKDGGENWENISAKLQSFPGAGEVELAIFDLTKENSFLVLTPYGILRSDDGGDTWSDYKLLVQPGRVKILSFSFNPYNPNEIYYVTNTTFYKSIDGGKRWQTKSLPTARIPTVLVVDPANPNNLFLGGYKPKQK